jgi:glycosyltransferase involved in cell wall biosynthesis
MQPIVSVIIVTFNAEAHIEQAVKSFLTQTFERKELVIIDGGSTDNTISIIGGFDQSLIKWISEPDKGIYDAMNKGIKMAKGEWLYFLGADDYFINNLVLEKVFERPYADIMYGDVYSVQLRRKYDGPTNSEKLLFSNLCHQSIFYKRVVFEKAGLYSLDFKLFSDWEFNIRCFFNKEIQTKYIDLVIAVYAEGGLSTLNTDIDFIRNFLFPLNLKYLNDSGISKLESIRFYDQWWRLIRSMRLRTNMDDAQKYSKSERIPMQIRAMISFQSKIPESLLWKGMFSKSFMLLSYVLKR